MQPRSDRVIVYRRGYVWYGDCSQCPRGRFRAVSAFLPNAHRKAMAHVEEHRAEVRDA